MWRSIQAILAFYIHNYPIFDTPGLSGLSVVYIYIRIYTRVCVVSSYVTSNTFTRIRNNNNKCIPYLEEGTNKFICENFCTPF